MLYVLLFNLIISGFWCQDIERVVVPRGEPFSFDCQPDESVYFGRQLNTWSEIQENDDIYLELKLNLNQLIKENVLRVTSDSAESVHVGFYACRKPTWTSASMSSIYQLILADVQSFYWTYICHGPIGSCQRSDDLIDENLSQFEVADQTDIELFCCASVTGYKNVNIHMNHVGESRSNVEVNKKQELDGSWVVCANQRTNLRRTPYQNQQTLTCELLTDDRRHSKLTSVIIMKDATVHDSLPGHSRQNLDNEYFSTQTSVSSRQRSRLTTGKKLAIIFGSIFGSLLLLGLLGFLFYFIRRNKQDSSSSNTNNASRYSPVKPSEPQQRYANQKNPLDVEHIYEEPTELSENSPVFIRC